MQNKFDLLLTFILLVSCLILLTSCTNNQQSVDLEESPTTVLEIMPTAVASATPSPTDTATTPPIPTDMPTAVTTAEPEPTTLPATPTEILPPTPTTSHQNNTTNHSDTIIVDHTAVDLFDQIPEEYITQAASLKMIYIDRSVGDNINDALDCLSHPSQEQAPNHCKRTDHVQSEFSVPAAIINWQHPTGYDRQNWAFATWEGENCSEWSDKINCFIQMITPIIDQYDVVSYQLSYLAVNSGSNITDATVGYFADNPNNYDVFDQEAFEEKHPDKNFIYWTTSLSRSIGTEESDEFNDQMRAYAQTNNKILFDVADILSHDPNGQPCYDNRDNIPYDNGNKSENYPDDGENHLAICPHYTTEVEGGHLGSVSAGKIRVAKAFWVLMARIAGWDGTVN